MPINASPEFDSLFAEVEIENFQEDIFLEHKATLPQIYNFYKMSQKIMLDV